jgi:hypothetical protein
VYVDRSFLLKCIDAATTKKKIPKVTIGINTIPALLEEALSIILIRKYSKRQALI